MKANCCKEVTSTFQIKSDQEKTSQFLIQANDWVQLIELTNIPVMVPGSNMIQKVPEIYHPPPYKPKAALFILDRVILI